MPATNLPCPSCGLALLVNDPNPAGKGFMCPHCRKPFVVPARASAPQSKPATPDPEPARSEARKPPAPARTSPKVESPPAPARKEESPRQVQRPRRAPRDEDRDELPSEKRPARPDATKKPKAALYLAVGGAVGLLLVCGICAGVGVYALGWVGREGANNSMASNEAPGVPADKGDKASSSEDRKETAKKKAGPKTPVYTTPQEAFDAVATAEINGDHKTFVAGHAPEAQKKLALEAALPGLADRPTEGKDAEEMAKMFKPLADALARHGLTEEAIKKIKRNRDPKNPARTEQALLALIKDPAAFLVDVMTALDSVLGGKGKKEYTKKLIDVKIAGDKATGTAITSFRSSEEKKPVSLVKIDNTWRMLYEPERKPKKKDELDTKVAFKITALALTAELIADEKACNKKYEGKILEVDGVVQDANKVLSPGIELVGTKKRPEDEEGLKVVCEGIGPKDKAWWLGQGQKVKVVGRFKGGDAVFGLFLANCTIKALEPSPTRQITAKQLAAEVVKDRAAARSKYFGKGRKIELIVEGTVTGFRKGEVVIRTAPHFVSLAGTDGFPVDCEVEPAEIKTLKKGDKVKLKGIWTIDLFDDEEKRIALRYGFVLEKE